MELKYKIFYIENGVRKISIIESEIENEVSAWNYLKRKIEEKYKKENKNIPILKFKGSVKI